MVNYSLLTLIKTVRFIIQNIGCDVFNADNRRLQPLLKQFLGSGKGGGMMHV